MESKILLSADTPCDIGPELQERYNVQLYPLHVISEGEDYLDNFTITPEELFTVYRKTGHLPRTSAINEQEYIDYFTPWIEQGYDIIHFNIATAISSSHLHAKAAAEKLGHVYPIDTRSLSSGVSLPLLQAGDMIKQGVDVEDIVEEATRLLDCVHASFVMDTCDYLAAGGRCSTVTALVSSALNIKPQINVDNQTGEMYVAKKFRGKLEKVLERYIREKIGAYDDIKLDHVFITHPPIRQSCRDLARETLLDLLPFQEIHDTQASCVISSHCGPGTLGVLFLTDTPSD